jgi:hypothetical protein
LPYCSRFSDLGFFIFGIFGFSIVAGKVRRFWRVFQCVRGHAVLRARRPGWPGRRMSTSGGRGSSTQAVARALRGPRTAAGSGKIPGSPPRFAPFSTSAPPGGRSSQVGSDWSSALGHAAASRAKRNVEPSSQM